MGGISLSPALLSGNCCASQFLVPCVSQQESPLDQMLLRELQIKCNAQHLVLLREVGPGGERWGQRVERQR